MHSSFRLYLMHGNLSAVTNSASILALITFADSLAHVSYTVFSLSQRELSSVFDDGKIIYLRIL